MTEWDVISETETDDFTDELSDEALDRTTEGQKYTQIHVCFCYSGH